MSSTSKGFSMLLETAKAVGLTERAPDGDSLVNRAERDELTYVAKHDPVMAAAMRKARETLANFLALAAAPRGDMTGFAVKVAIRDDCDGAEYFWIHPFEHSAGRFSGRLNNTPRAIARWRMGDTIQFTTVDVVDWMYMDGGTMHGNYTARALLRSATQEERDAFRRRFGLDCDF